MFRQAFKWATRFLKNEEGRLPVEHALATSAVVGIIIASISSFGPHATRIYGGKVLGGSDSPYIESVNGLNLVSGQGEGNGSGASPGFLAHLTSGAAQNTVDAGTKNPDLEPVLAPSARLLAVNQH